MLKRFRFGAQFLLYLSFMAGNIFGHMLRLASFGESHGPMIGGVLDGFPSGFTVDSAGISLAMERRKPGQGKFQTARSEADVPQFVSGIYEGKTTGAPIAFLIANKDHRPEDYNGLAGFFRPSHAAFAWDKKYGHQDMRGGGRSSARETAVRVVAGALAAQLLGRYGITISACVSQIGNVKAAIPDSAFVPEQIYSSELRCPDTEAADLMDALLTELKSAGDTTGGVVSCRITGVPAGIGEPVFDRLQADLAKAMMGINAAKGFDYGDGFAAAASRGSAHNDPFSFTENAIRPASNHAGGILGGISTGEPILFRVAFKPVSSLGMQQRTVDIHGTTKDLTIKGRHDVCIVPRAVPVVEAMAALVIADHMIMSGLIRHNNS